MTDLLREAVDITFGGKSGETVLREACQTAWYTVLVATPERLAAVTHAAWIAEARVAKTAYSKNCCLGAARKWKART
jgi:hypothetical protein